MNRYILVAGPQAAGKSTVIANLKDTYEKAQPFFPERKLASLVPLQETRQIIAHKYMLLGAIFMTCEHEAEVVDSDLRRMDTILERDKGDFIHVDECNIFTIAHAAAHGIFQVEEYWDEYVRRLERLNAKVIFLDVPWEVSWQRRRKHYEQRLMHFPELDQPQILERYREYLEKLHPLLKDLYRRLPFDKQMIDGSLPQDLVAQKMVEGMTEKKIRDRIRSYV